MKVLSGSFKNRKIQFRKNLGIRPTRNIVKKSFFDTIRPIIAGSTFLDLFAGVGNMGIEALSQGAQKAIMVERDQENAAFIRRNVRAFGLSEACEVHKMDAFLFLETHGLKGADIVYADPPYSFETMRLLLLLSELMDGDTILCIEHSLDNVLKDSYGRLERIKERVFSRTVLTYYRSSHE